MNHTTEKHTATPTPWKFHLGRGANPRFHIQTEGGYQIASTTPLDNRPDFPEDDARQANAELICRAVNSHSALVEALEIVLDQLAPKDHKGQCVLYSDCLHPSDDDKTIVDYLRETLKLAKGE